MSVTVAQILKQIDDAVLELLAQAESDGLDDYDSGRLAALAELSSEIKDRINE